MRQCVYLTAVTTIVPSKNKAGFYNKFFYNLPKKYNDTRRDGVHIRPR